MSRFTVLQAVVLGTFVVVAPSMVESQPTAKDFRITDLGTFGAGGGSYARAINNRGQVVGYSYGPDGVTRALLWEHGVAIDLDVDAHSYAWDVNDAGQIVGESFAGFADPGTAFIWHKGNVIELQSPSHAQAINNKGDVVGIIPTPGVATCCGFHFDKTTGTMRNLGAYWPHDINEQGQIVGGRRTAGGSFYPFLWDASTGFVTIGLDGSPGHAWAVNDLGQVVGSVSVSDDPNDLQRAFLWDHGTAMQLEVGGGDEIAHDINNKGQVVGESSQRAVLWEQGKLILLPEQAEPSFAFAINDNGEIVGAGGRADDAQLHAVVWSRK